MCVDWNPVVGCQQGKHMSILKRDYWWKFWQEIISPLSPDRVLNFKNLTWAVLYVWEIFYFVMLLQSSMHLQFCKRKRMTAMSEERCEEAIGQVTDCKTSNQMRTREQEMPESPQIYMLPAPRGIRHKNCKNKKHRVESRKNGQWVRVQTLWKGKPRKRLKQGEHEAEDPESTAHQLALI